MFVSRLPRQSLIRQCSTLPVHPLRQFSVYGAPFTNSIKCRSSNSTDNAAKLLQYQLSIPDLPFCTIELAKDNTFAALEKEIQETMGVQSVRFLINGRYVLSGETLVSTCLSSTLDIEIDKVRYNVNEGSPIYESGKVYKKSKLKQYGMVVTGASAILVACVVMWRTVLPKEHQKRLT